MPARDRYLTVELSEPQMREILAIVKKHWYSTDHPTRVARKNALQALTKGLEDGVNYRAALKYVIERVEKIAEEGDPIHTDTRALRRTMYTARRRLTYDTRR